MAFVIRLTLAQFADVVINAEVLSVSGDRSEVEIEMESRTTLLAGRVIDARGLGDPDDQDIANGETILSFPQFMRRMAGMWPLRGLRRVAVVGSGDSAKCAVESFLGIVPQPLMAAAALDSVDQIGWCSDELPTTCDDWQQDIRGRYQAIGRYLRPDRFGVRRLDVLSRRAWPVALPGAALIDGCSYDLVVLCTGHQENTINGLHMGSFNEYAISGRNGRRSRALQPACVSSRPHARLPFTAREREDGIASIAENSVAMFRTSGKTAALAATLRSTRQA